MSHHRSCCRGLATPVLTAYQRDVQVQRTQVPLSAAPKAKRDVAQPASGSSGTTGRKGVMARCGSLPPRVFRAGDLYDIFLLYYKCKDSLPALSPTPTVNCGLFGVPFLPEGPGGATGQRWCLKGGNKPLSPQVWGHFLVKAKPAKTVTGSKEMGRTPAPCGGAPVDGCLWMQPHIPGGS